MTSTSAQARQRRADALATYLEPVFSRLRLDGRPEDPAQLHHWLADVVRTQVAEGDALYDQYASAALQPPHRSAHREGRPQRALTWYRQHLWNVPGVVFLLVTGLAIAAYVLFRLRPDWQVPAALGFVVMLAALLPGFLYLRFIRFRIGPLCAEYVENLHRLGVEDAGFLPEPLRASSAWARWYDSGGPGYRNEPSIYELKFAGQYGRWPASNADEHRDSTGRLMSVYLCLATLAVGWAFVVWTEPLAGSLPRLADALRFGFLGAYFFLLSLLIRRYFQNDLRPGAYLAGVVRVVTVLVLVAGVDQTFAMGGAPADRPLPVENAVAFVVGVFPTVGMQLLRRAVGKVTGRFRGGVEPPYPLSQLDGMDIWSEARLVEVGIEDVQHLATANLVDLVLGARIPTQRIVDWVDQALLLLRTGLPRIDNLRDYTTYADLRALSVRSSSDLLELVEKLQLDLAPNGPWPGIDSPVGALAAVPPAPPQPIGGPSLIRTAAVPLLTRIALAATTLQHEPNLTLILHWHACEPEADLGERRPARPAQRSAGSPSSEDESRSAARAPAGNSSGPGEARSPAVVPGTHAPTG